MPAKTNTKNAKQQIYLKNRPFISRVTIDGMILGGLGFILACSAVVCFSTFLKTADMQAEVIASAETLNPENIANENAKNIILNDPTSAESAILLKQYENSKLIQDLNNLQSFNEDMRFFFLLSVIFGSLALAVFVADFVYVNHASIRLAQKM